MKNYLVSTLILATVFFSGCMENPEGDALTNPASAAETFRVGPDQPYKTISSALAEMKDGDVCIIGPGIYREWIEVAQSKVTLRGEGRVIISGNDELQDPKKITINGHEALVFDLEQPVYDVFTGGQYLHLARHPNKTVAMTSNEDWEHSFIDLEGTVRLGNDLYRQFPEINDGHYLGLHGNIKQKEGKLNSWYSIRLPITGLTSEGLLEVDAGQASSGYMGPYGQGNGIGYIIGAKAVLDAPGEWHSDGNELTLIPPAGAQGPVEARTRLYGALITGDGVSLENIAFKAATARIDGDNVSLRRCSFEHISPFQPNPDPNREEFTKRGQSFESCWGIPDNATAGVYVEGSGFVAEDCRFAKSWWCGMMIRGNQARIENCVFEDLNWMASRAAGLYSWGDGNVVRYSTLRNLGGAGIEGGNLYWVEQNEKNNVWEYNHISDYSKLIVDQGAYYVNQQYGSRFLANSIWRYNVASNASGPQKGDWQRHVAAYYIDNSSSGYRVHNNIAIDVIDPMKHNDTQDGEKASQELWFYNNTFYRCGYSAFGAHGKSKERDADLNVINNLAIESDDLALGRVDVIKNYANNVSTELAAVQNAARGDFTPLSQELTSGGVPVDGEAIPYIGAVDPAKGMWRYGADESKLLP